MIPRPSSLHQLFTSDSDEVESQHTGLVNLGNTCYANAVLSCLAFLPDEIWVYLKKYLFITHECHNGKYFLYYLENIRTYRNNALVRFDTAIPYMLDKMSFAFKTQHDATEFLNKLYDNNIQESILTNLFKIETCVRKHCATCFQQVGSSYENVISNILDITLNETQSCELQGLINQRPLELRPDYKCNNCNKKGTSYFQYLRQKLPPLLTVRLMRYAFNNETKTASKNVVKVGYEEKLNVDYKVNENSDIAVKNYNLVSFICHKGQSLNTGHYISYVKKDDVWFEYDDSKKTGPLRFDQIDKTNTFLLFYSRDIEMSEQGIKNT